MLLSKVNPLFYSKKTGYLHRLSGNIEIILQI